jgi:hypothetical protein
LLVYSRFDFFADQCSGRINYISLVKANLSCIKSVAILTTNKNAILLTEIKANQALFLNFTDYRPLCVATPLSEGNMFQKWSYAKKH